MDNARILRLADSVALVEYPRIELKDTAKAQDTEIKVWIVDGEYVRTYIDEEYTNFGQHYRFPFIPETEFWLDKESSNDESSYYIEHLKVEWALMRNGKSYAEAIVQADQVEKELRRKDGDIRQVIDPIRKIVDPKLFRVKLIKTLESGVKVWVVNGRLVRSVLNIDFSVSGEEEVFYRNGGLTGKIKLKDFDKLGKEVDVLSVDGDSLKTEWKRVARHIKHKTVEPLVEIVTHTGRKFRVTQSHSCLTCDDDGNLSKIAPKNMTIGKTLLPVISGMQEAGSMFWNIQKYVLEKDRKNSLGKTIPTKLVLTPDLGFLLGIYLAEGYVSRGLNIVISAMCSEIREKIKQSARLLNLHPTTLETAIVLNNKRLATALRCEFGIGSSCKFLPDWVYMAPKEFREALIDGYWSGDGSIYQRDGTIIATAQTNSKKLADGIQGLLAGLGVQCVVCRFECKHPQFKNACETHFRMRIPAAFVGSMPKMTHPEKETHRQLWKLPRWDSIAFAPVPMNLTKGSLRYRGKKGFTGLTNMMRKHKKGRIASLISNLLWDKVVSIREIPIEEFTYDLEVADNHNFVLANGVVVHNTQGGHPLVYEFVPPMDVWIDNDLDWQERGFVILHELHEMNRMEQGLSYSQAHAESSALELRCRKQIDDLHDALALEGWS